MESVLLSEHEVKIKSKAFTMAKTIILFGTLPEKFEGRDMSYEAGLLRRLGSSQHGPKLPCEFGYIWHTML